MNYNDKYVSSRDEEYIFLMNLQILIINIWFFQCLSSINYDDEYASFKLLFFLLNKTMTHHQVQPQQKKEHFILMPIFSSQHYSRHLL